jgi:hypothetical protein
MVQVAAVARLRRYSKAGPYAVVDEVERGRFTDSRGSRVQRFNIKI